MKKSKKKLTFASTALATGALLGLTGCPVNAGVYGPPQNDPQPDVYGPPVINEEDIDGPIETVYGPPESFDDDVNIPAEPVYGPPPDIDDPIEEVYGPPEDFSYDDSMETSAAPDDEDDKSGKEESSDDLSQPIAPVYGPPEP